MVHGKSKVKGKKKDKKDERGRSKSHGRSKSCGNSKEKCCYYDKSDCFCKECKEEKNKKKRHFDLDSDKSSQDDDEAFVATLATHASKDVWILDSCASFHMTSHRGWLSKRRI